MHPVQLSFNTEASLIAVMLSGCDRSRFDLIKRSCCFSCAAAHHGSDGCGSNRNTEYSPEDIAGPVKAYRTDRIKGNGKSLEIFSVLDIGIQPFRKIPGAAVMMHRAGNFKAVVGCKSNLHTGIQNISGFHNDGRFMTFLIMRAAAASCRHVINYAVRLAGQHEC